MSTKVKNVKDVSKCVPFEANLPCATTAMFTSHGKYPYKIIC